MANLKLMLGQLLESTAKASTIIYLIFDLSAQRESVSLRFTVLKRNITLKYFKIKSSILKLSGSFPTKSDERTNKCIMTGKLLSELGHYEEAIKLYDRALDGAPLFAEVFYDKGSALSELGRFEDSIESYDRALKLEPTFSRALVNKGKILYRLGRYEEAIDCYKKAIDINPHLVDAWYNKGLALNKLGRHEEAIKAYDESIKIAPLHIDSWIRERRLVRKR